MRTLSDEIQAWRCNSQPDATKDDVIPVLLAMLARIEALEGLLIKAETNTPKEKGPCA